MVTGPDDSSGKEDCSGKQRSLGGDAWLNQAQAREQKSDNRGGEYFEEALDPKMDHPPAPVFNDGKVGVLSPGQAGGVEHADSRR